MTPNYENRVEIFITALCYVLKRSVMSVQKNSVKFTLKGNGMRTYWNSLESDEEFTDLQRQGK